MLDFGKYIPESVRRWMAPSEKKAEPAPERAPEPVAVAEYVRTDGTEGDRRTRIMKTSEETLSRDSVRERFLIQADVGVNDAGDRAFDTVGKRTAQFNRKERIVYFEDTSIGDEFRGSGLGTDSYKAFIDYANRRAREIDIAEGRDPKEPWSVLTAPESPITRHQFEKFFHARDQGLVMVGKLRSLEAIETEEKLAEARKRIEEITARKAA